MILLGMSDKRKLLLFYHFLKCRYSDLFFKSIVIIQNIFLKLKILGSRQMTYYEVL